MQSNSWWNGRLNQDHFCLGVIAKSPLHSHKKSLRSWTDCRPSGQITTPKGHPVLNWRTQTRTSGSSPKRSRPPTSLSLAQAPLLLSGRDFDATFSIHALSSSTSCVVKPWRENHGTDAIVSNRIIRHSPLPASSF